MPSPAIFFPDQGIETFRNPFPAPLTSDLTCNIYPLRHLSTLIQKIQEKSIPIRTIRYLVDSSKNIWFAEEGAPSKTTPAHCRMTGNPPAQSICIAAGNIGFSDDFTQINMVNNKSGDFKPNFDSVKWPLAILAANQECLAKSSLRLNQDIRIEQLAGGNFQDLHYFTATELNDWVSTFSSDELESLKEQPPEIKQVSYQIPVAKLIQRHGALALNVDEDDDDDDVIEFVLNA